jgi:hypothetical protein
LNRYRGVEVPLNVFDFTISRHRDGPGDFFQDFSGVLLGDCWHSFEAITVASQAWIIRAVCNANSSMLLVDAYRVLFAFAITSSLGVVSFAQAEDGLAKVIRQEVSTKTLRAELFKLRKAASRFDESPSQAALSTFKK